MWLKKYLLLSLVFVCVLVLPQDTLTSQYLNIRSKLTELKSQSEYVTEQLKIVSEKLLISQKEAKEWEQTSKTLSDSLMNINQQYNDCYEQLVIEKNKNRTLSKILISLIVVFAVLILIKVIFIVLWAKSVPMSRIIDIIV